jgi:hypothetical protein
MLSKGHVPEGRKESVQRMPPGEARRAKDELHVNWSLTENAVKFRGGAVEAAGRGGGHRLHGSDASRNDQGKHHGIFDGRRAIFLTQQSFQEIDHGDYSRACCCPLVYFTSRFSAAR